MSLINNLCMRLERHPKRVVFPEGNDVRILQAARKFAVKKLGIPILLGNRIEIKELANKLDIKMATPKYKKIIYDEIKKNNPKLSDYIIESGFKLYWLTKNI